MDAPKNIGSLQAVGLRPEAGTVFLTLFFDKGFFATSLLVDMSTAEVAARLRSAADALDATVEMSPEGLKAAAESTHCPVLGPGKPHQWYHTSIPKQKRCEVCGMIGEIA